MMGRTMDRENADTESAGTRSKSNRRGRPGLVAVWSAVLALAAVVALVLVPTGTGVTYSSTSDGSETVVEERTRLLDEEGLGVLGVLAIPVLFAVSGAALGIALRSRVPLAVAAGLLWTFSLLALFSIGIFFVPAAVAMTMAASLRQERSTA